MAENTIILAFLVLFCQVHIKAQIYKPAIFPSLLSPTFTAPSPTQVTSLSLSLPQTTSVSSPIAISFPEPVLKPLPLPTIAPLPPPTVIIQPPTTSTIPLIPTTVINNRLANSLANVIQLLIVSKLADSSKNPTSFPPFLSKVGPLLDAIGTIGTTYTPGIDIPVKPAEFISYDAPVYSLPSYSFTEVINQLPVTATETSIYGTVTEVLPVPNTVIYATASEVITPAPVTPLSVSYAPEYFGATEVKSPPATGSFVGITEVFHYR